MEDTKQQYGRCNILSTVKQWWTKDIRFDCSKTEETSSKTEEEGGETAIPHKQLKIEENGSERNSDMKFKDQLI